jgi:hypothetical protein
MPEKHEPEAVVLSLFISMWDFCKNVSHFFQKNFPLDSEHDAGTVRGAAASGRQWLFGKDQVAAAPRTVPGRVPIPIVLI